MNNREKSKEIVREHIFAIHEAFETNNIENIRRIEVSIRYKLDTTRYRGHKLFLKDFIYEYLGNKYLISYEWDYVFVKGYRRKKQYSTNIHYSNYSKTFRWVEDKTKPKLTKYTIIKSVHLRRLNNVNTNTYII